MKNLTRHVSGKWLIAVLMAVVLVCAAVPAIPEAVDECENPDGHSWICVPYDEEIHYDPPQEE